MANSKIASTKKLIKDIVVDKETSRKERITDVEKAYITYQTAISIDINYPLKNLQFIPSSIPLGSLDGLQRPVITAHGNTLAKSMKMMGNIRPIIVTKLKEKNGKYKFYVLDGQHNYNALLSLKAEEIPIVEISTKSTANLVETIALLNSSSKSWTLKDYVTAWSNIHSDYGLLKRLYDKYDIELSIVAAVCTGANLGSATPATKLIKSGEFRIFNLSESEQKLSDINEILNELPRMDRAANRYFILSLISVFNEITYGRKEHNKLLDYVKNNREILKFALNNVNELKEYLLQAFN